MAFASMNVRTDKPFVLSMMASYADGKDVSMMTVPSCTAHNMRHCNKELQASTQQNFEQA